ncbi:MAG: cyclic nucleotide-binding domain-containing protein [Pirellulaceae bacterium]|nr:cyclic nucleotide-binding domain-containing protein [Pirellulaceae bacterium]
MLDALSLLKELDDQDIEWILEAGDERQVIASTVVIREGTQPDALYFVLEGLLGITVTATGDKQLATLGPGELVGEISLLEDRPATATVSAVENSLLLAVPRTQLLDKLEHDPRFAAHVYKSFALISSRRLRERVGTLGQLLQAKATTDRVVASHWGRMDEAIDQFKAFLQQLEEAARQHQGQVPRDLADEALVRFRQFCQFINDQVGESATLDEHVKEDLGRQLKREILPYLLLTQTAERCYSKPRGYAGDFLSIEQIYQNRPSGSGRIGPLLDECFLNEPAAKAVRNRRGLLAEQIGQTLRQSGNQPARITSLACGPAQELFDVLQSHPARPPVATLIDIDVQALEFVNARAEQLGLRSHLHTINGNLVYLATGRTRLELPPQHLVYSIGLIDYFNDKFVLKLMDYAHGLLAPGGRLILGNFHPRNGTKALMDHILEWRLIHRTEEDMNRLFAASRFQRPATRILFEPEGVNLFAECVKP